ESFPPPGSLDSHSTWLTCPGAGHFLETPRKNPLHSGLPVFVLSGKEINEKEEAILAELASAVVTKVNAPEELRRLLGSVFNLEHAEPLPLDD
ncbi:MAG: hypothetical protein O2992_15500, partial [Gemmatimonadetes bacterium]|nr:hypothetical protein [Gemmatimonadota bacterium]